MRFLKICLTILLFFIAGNIFSQSDTALQRMIDEAKAKAAQQKKDTGPAKKMIRPLKKDSVFLNDTVVRKKITPLLNDSPSLVIQDTAIQKIQDTTFNRVDTLPPKVAIKNEAIPWTRDTAFARLLYLPGLLNASKMPIHEGERRVVSSKDFFFYFFASLLLFLGIIRQSFPGYIKNVFGTLFLQAQRYKQSREKTMQDTVPSLLLNILFFIVAGFWITFFIKDIPIYHFTFAQKIVAVIALITFIYAIKAMIISLAGTIFHKRDAANAYTLIVFHVNKVAGIILLPLAILYTYGGENQQSLTASLAIAIGILLLIYRYIVSLIDMTGRFKINSFYFFIYICITEILPILICYGVVPGIISKIS